MSVGYVGIRARSRPIARAVAGLAAPAAAAAVALAAPTIAQAQVQSYGTNNYGTFYNVLPPGTNGFENVLQLAQYELTGARPAHNTDQLAMYSNLTTAAPDIQASQISNFFKDATFGIPTGDAAGSESPEPGVTIVRDVRFGVPHIYGDTRAELMFGIGYATAEDRLFFIDALRHAGQGDLASFAGGANVAMDAGTWASTPYTQQDLENQINQGIANLPDGQQILSDATNYVDGINAYISRAQVDPLLMPGEYAAIGDLGGPTPFTLEDMVSIASLVGGIFGQGGGGQLSNAVLYENLRQRFGPEHYVVPGSPEGVKAQAVAVAVAARRAKPANTRPHRPRHVSDHSGFATFMSFVDPKDPEAPTTVQGKSFPYQTLRFRAGPRPAASRCPIQVRSGTSAT